jgi:hypothetical protein
LGRRCHQARPPDARGRVDARFDSLEGRLNARFETFEARTDARFESFEGRIEAKIERATRLAIVTSASLVVSGFLATTAAIALR